MISKKRKVNVGEKYSNCGKSMKLDINFVPHSILILYQLFGDLFT